MSEEKFNHIEKLLEQLIGAVGHVGAELEEIKATMATKEELAIVKADIAEMKSDIAGMNAEITEIKGDIAEMKTDIAGMKTDIANLEGQMIETNQIVKAIMHRSEETDAKLEGLAVNTASQTSVERIEKAIDRMAGDISFLARKAIEHDDDIRALRRAK